MDVPGLGDRTPVAGYEDWSQWLGSRAAFVAESPESQSLADVLGLRTRRECPAYTIEHERSVSGVRIQTVSWSVGFGPRTSAFVLAPRGSDQVLPGVLAMHCHGGVRWIGAEQLVDLGRDRTRESTQLRDTYYDGLAPANELARRGYVVMVHDTFSWGSRRFELSAPTFKVETVMRAFDALWREQGISKTEAERFNVASDIHEDSLAKLAGMLNHTLAGAIVSDDLVALDVLAGLPNVDSRRLGTFGFSGGGARSLFLAALDSRITSYVVTCMMSTFASLFPNFVDAHSWLLNSPGLWNLRDWPTLSQLASARSFLVQYRAEDEYFPAKGMRDADSMLGELDNRRGRYHRAFHPGGHQFDAEMQNEAWDFFDRTLRGIAT